MAPRPSSSGGRDKNTLKPKRGRPRKIEVAAEKVVENEKSRSKPAKAFTSPVRNVRTAPSDVSMLSPDRLEKEENARNLVKREFFLIRRSYERNELKQMKEDFTTFRAKHRMPKYRTKDKTRPAALVLPSGLDEETLPYNEKYKVSNKVMSSCQYAAVHHLETKQEVLPRMKFFVFTERNIMGPDSLRLSHIPYVHDSFSEEEAFLSELREAFTEGIHGADLGCGEYINNYMMYLLLQATQEKWKDDLSHLHEAIFQLFPNKFSFKQLEENMFINLRERFKKSPPPVFASTDEKFNSIATMYCPRCDIFDCNLHGHLDEKNLSMCEMPQGELAEFAQPARPCGKRCFLNDQSSSTDKMRLFDLPEVVQGAFRVALQSTEEVNICRLTERMNILCRENGIEEIHCQKWYRMACEVSNTHTTDTSKPKNLTIRERYKKFKTILSKIDNEVKKVACVHEGPCVSDPDCVCRTENTTCTKFCKCDDSCIRKFPGCACQPGMCHTNACPCFLARWECDPDTCLSCGSDPVVATEEANNKENGGPAKICHNIGLQCHLQKIIRVGTSCIAGYGCFVDEEVEKGELISEYTGEVISQLEAERRGRIYDKLNLSYVFGLNKDECLDAGRMGNLIRFANHQDNNQNCEGRIMIVNGEQRVGVYAARKIEKGEELFFNYNYSDSAQQYVSIKMESKKKRKEKA